MPRTKPEKLEELLRTNENKYIVVRPSAMSAKYEAINLFNGDVLHRGDREDVIEWCQEREMGENRHFDYMLVVRGPDDD